MNNNPISKVGRGGEGYVILPPFDPNELITGPAAYSNGEVEALGKVFRAVATGATTKTGVMFGQPQENPVVGH